jgi:hypothetical protein
VLTCKACAEAETVVQYAGIILGAFAAIFVLPALAARFVVGGGWQQVGTSYAIWFAILWFTLGSSGSARWIEKFNWMMLSAAILTIVAVPLLTGLQRLGGWFWPEVADV